MAVREILRMGDPRLLQVSSEIQVHELGSLPELIEDMWETMQATDGIGLAAPQIGVFLRLVVFGIEATLRYPEAPPIPPTVLINPRIETLTQERSEGWEGCLSVPGMRGLVPRYERIRYRGIDAQGQRVDVDDVSAGLNDGVLEIVLPKSPEEKPRTIEVKHK